MKTSHGVAKAVICRWRGLRTGFLLVAVSNSFLSMALSQEDKEQHPANRNFWLHTNALQLQEDLEWIKQENKLYREAGLHEPWVGIRFGKTWGSVQLDENQFDFQEILSVLDKVNEHGLKASLTISDKLWSFSPNYPYKGAPVPKHLDVGPLKDEDFTLHVRTLANGVQKNAWYEGEFIHARSELILRKDRHVKKYFAKRWKVESQWKKFWTIAAESIGKHPALAAIVTPESSIGYSGPNSQKPPWKFEYPGGKQYADYLIRQAKFMRELFPQSVAIANNVNWITPDVEAHHSRVATEVANLETGWWAQDLTDIFKKYPLYVYPQLKKFPRERRWGVISGESHLGKLKAEDLLDMVDELDIGQLVFYPRRKTPEHEQVFELLRDRIKKSKSPPASMP